MKFLNESTAQDENGLSWFRNQTYAVHAYWPTCTECGKRTDVWWTCWPRDDRIVCDKCKEKL